MPERPERLRGGRHATLARSGRTPPAPRPSGPRRLALALLLALSGCDATLQNRGEAYPALSAIVEVRLASRAAGLASAEFRLDGEVVGHDPDPADGLSYDLDTTRYPNGYHLLKVSGLDAAGGVQVEEEHAIVIRNAPP